jgi:1-acyl-sn-glycerol-3-phosphate acyltransferase
MTIFNTPILSRIFHYTARFFMRLFGWRVDGTLPALPKFVLIGAPHTSSWDFVLFLGVIFTLRANVKFMGKAELFRPPFGWFFYFCGGVPVDRKKPGRLVEQMVEACNKSSQFILTIAPEGTRHKVKEWKRGYYHIAKGAGIPIVMAKVDGRQRPCMSGKPII